MVVTYLPGDLGTWLRYKYWRRRLKHLGQGVRIDAGVAIVGPDRVSIGDNCWIDRNVHLLAGIDASTRERITRPNDEYTGEPGMVRIGSNVHVGPGSILSGISGGIHVSDDCGFSAQCRVYASSHHYKSAQDPTNRDFSFGPMVPHARQCLVVGPVWIGRNTGIALGATILPGASIGADSFVGIGTVVGGAKFPENSMIAGNPAKRIADRFPGTST